MKAKTQPLKRYRPPAAEAPTASSLVTAPPLGFALADRGPENASNQPGGGFHVLCGAQGAEGKLHILQHRTALLAGGKMLLHLRRPRPIKRAFRIVRQKIGDFPVRHRFFYPPLLTSTYV